MENYKFCMDIDIKILYSMKQLIPAVYYENSVIWPCRVYSKNIRMVQFKKSINVIYYINKLNEESQ